MFAYLSKCKLTLENFELMRKGLFTHKGGKKKILLKKQAAKQMPLVDEELDTDGTHPEHLETANRTPKKPSLMDRLGTKNYLSNSGTCVSCGKKDENDPDVVFGIDLVRAILSVKSENNPKVDKLIRTEREVDVAIKLTSVITKALSKRVDVAQFQIQQIGFDSRSNHSDQVYRPRSPQRDHRPRTPPREHRPRTPQRDYRQRSPRRDYRSRSPRRDVRPRSPRQEYRQRSPRQEYKPRSPRQEFRPRSPRHEYRPRSPRQDFIPRSPKRAYRSRSPPQNYINRSPAERNQWDQGPTYFQEKGDSAIHQRRENGERFDHRYPQDVFPPRTSLGQGDRGIRKYVVEEEDGHVTQFHHDNEKRPMDQVIVFFYATPIIILELRISLNRRF
jgi:hypothetical protein